MGDQPVSKTSPEGNSATPGVQYSLQKVIPSPSQSMERLLGPIQIPLLHMQRIKMHLLNKKISLGAFFFFPNGRFTNEICQMGLPSLLAALSNGDLGKIISFDPTSPFHPQDLISSNRSQAGRDGQI